MILFDSRDSQKASEGQLKHENGFYFCTQLNYSEAMTLYTTISRIYLVMKLLLLHKSKCKS